MGRQIAAAIVAIALLMTMASMGCIVEGVGADEIVVIQAPGTGTLHWYTSPGWKWQGGGGVTTYKKRDIYEFSALKVRFNDGGHAEMNGSIQFDMPVDMTNLNSLHSKYGSMEAIKLQIMKTVVDKVLYMTGPHMSSRESYAEKRTDLIRLVQEQIDGGVYRVVTTLVETTDPVSGMKTTATAAAIARDAAGLAIRQESSVVGEFGLHAFNFAISEIKYDAQVEKQIQSQQDSMMGVQTAIMNARRAEQQRITTEQEGMATAAKAKWEQETIKAKAIVQGEQERDVAKLSADAAEQYKREQLLRADADSSYKRQVMAADGALTQKLLAITTINAQWAEAFSKYQGSMVPSVVMGASGSAGNAASNAQEFMSLLTAKAAKDLSLNLGVGRAEK